MGRPAPGPATPRAGLRAAAPAGGDGPGPAPPDGPPRGGGHDARPYVVVGAGVGVLMALIVTAVVLMLRT
ncbi:hypothetical protein [Streptomyces sp. CC228A]|uniref:hypothetical protein n=1 Tax=Streptomyces sp. CC228A TaxID=2898186 RepID=UPI001F329760|nr:hypothetical protein [Streptomyces sp. CC228A]